MLLMLRLHRVSRSRQVKNIYNTSFTSADLRSMPVTLEVVRRADADRWRYIRRKWR